MHALTEENLNRLFTSLEGLEPHFRMSQKKQALPVDVKSLLGFKNLYLLTSSGQLDVLSEVDGQVEYETVRYQSIELKLENEPIRVLNIDGIIQSKRFLKRAKDQFSILELERMRAKRSLINSQTA